MKTLLALCLPFLMIALLSCSQSSDPVENPPPTDPFELIAEESIGVEGGTLEAEGFELTIPAGAFESTQTLEVFVNDTEIPLSDHAVTAYYRVDGLPEELCSIITTIQMTGHSIWRGNYQLTSHTCQPGNLFRVHFYNFGM
jgi:hypothetical protein